MKVKDLTDQEFGRWTVLKRSGSDKHNKALWECVCSCGNIKEVVGSSLRRGLSCSCGCLHNELLIKINKTRSGENHYKYKHGLSKTNAYKNSIHAKRRATKLNQTPTNIRQDKIDLYYQICAYLNKSLDKPGWNVDHIQPLSKDGLHHEDNLQILSRELNFQKHDKWPLTDEEKKRYSGIRI